MFLPLGKIFITFFSLIFIEISCFSQAVIRQKPGVGIRSKASEDLNMTKVHQDDDYIYPSLELSDDEMEVGSFMASAKDDAWTPKVKVSSYYLSGV